MNEMATFKQAKAAASALLVLMRQTLGPENDWAAELPVAQLRVCGILYEGPRPMSVLSRELGVSLSAMTQIADRLERARVVRRMAKGTDRRVRWLRLTRRGERMMRVREAARIRRVRAVLEHLSPDARREALAALELLAGACNAATGRDTRVAAGDCVVLASKAPL